MLRQHIALGRSKRSLAIGLGRTGVRRENVPRTLPSERGLCRTTSRRELDAENLALKEKLRRQQEQLRDGLISRDAEMRDLIALLARRIAENDDAGETDETSAEQAGHGSRAAAAGR